MKKSPVLSSTPPYDADDSVKQCPPLKDTNANSDDSNNNSFYSVFQRGNKRASVKNIRDAFESAAAAASAKNNDHNKLSRQSNGVVTSLRKPSKIPAPQDRLLQSQTYIERLQRNLATRLSTATVEAFRRDYSPVRSLRTDDLKNNNEDLKEKENCGSGEKVITNGAKYGEEKELSSEGSVQQLEKNSQRRESEENKVERCECDHASRNCISTEGNRSALKGERSRESNFGQESNKPEIGEKRQSSKSEKDSLKLEAEQSRCEVEPKVESKNSELEKEIGTVDPERKNQNCEAEGNSRSCEVDQHTKRCTLEECSQACDIERDDKAEDKNSENKIDDHTCVSEIPNSGGELPGSAEHTDPKEACLCHCPVTETSEDHRPTSSTTESVHLDPSKNDEVKQLSDAEPAVESYDVKEEEPGQDNQLIIHSAARARKLEFLNGPKVASSPVAGQSEGKQQRVSWTTRLIQKLTEEEENAKKRVVKVVRPKRIVRFPQKKTPKELEKSKWKPVPPPRSSSVPSATDESVGQKEGVNRSGIKIDDDTKDAYASLISQLVQVNKAKKQSEIKSEPEEKPKEEETRSLDREDSWFSSTSEDDDQDSVIAAPGVVRQSNPEPSNLETESPMKKDGEAATGAGARSGKNTGIRRLLPTGLFSGNHSKNEPPSVTERLLKPTTMPAGHRVYPQQRPIVETAFLSSPTEPEKQRTRRSQSSSPATRHNNRKVQEVSNRDQTDSVSQRSKSLSPSRRSASSKRTIPETSLILEERLNHIRRELWQTRQQQEQQRRPASTTPVETSRHRQSQNSVPASPRSKASKSNSSDGGRGHYAVVRPPADAYFHSPPSRRRAQQQSMSHPNDQGTVSSVPQQRKTSSSASSTSTIVPEETPQTPNNTSWNPLLQQTISGSPDIRLLQQQQYRPQGGPYAVPVRSQHRSPEGLLQPVQNSVYNSPIPSGRLSAPPVPPSHYGQHIDVSSRHRVMSPELAVSYARRSVPHFSPPLSATIQVPSPSTSSSQSSPRQQDPVNRTSAQTQTTKSFIQQQQQHQQQMMDMSPKSSSSAGSTPGHRLSRQEVEALYWETQRLRAGLSDLSRHLARPQYAPVVKPQPVYNTRARSLSPMRQQVLSPPSSRSMSLPRDNYFTRGTPQRNTIGPIRTSSASQQHSPLRQQNNNTPTIYEDPQEEMNGTVQLRNHDEKQQQNLKPKGSQYPLPIFKRGSLYSSTSTTSVDSNVSQTFPKRVSFGSFPSDYYQSWPTRNGPASQPPTRQSRPDSIDSDVFLPEGYGTYANLPGVVSPPPRSSSHQQAPNRPLPPVPRGESPGYGVVLRSPHARWQQQSDTESGSEAGEVQRILQQGSQHRHSNGVTYFRFPPEEEWGADGKGRGPPGTDQSASSSSVGRDDGVRRGGGRSGRRDEPRRHTLSGDHHHAQAQQGGVLARSMDLEMSSKSQRRKSPLPRGYPPPSSAMLFDDDPGIMSEVETSSTGFRRGGKQRSSLPVVRTPSKTLERPLGLVFLQYRNETKRALLPNEITSIDTVKALFVRSFPKQLTMEYLDSPHVKIYIHDSSKDMFYELEDLRSHLRDIRDRSVLRLFESTDMNGGVLPGAGVGVVAPPMWDQDQSYFSEPEFDSEYQHQHIHKTKASKSGSSVPPQAPYYMTHSYPPGGGPGASATLPRGGPLLRAYSPAVAPPVPAERMKTLPQSGVQAPPKPVRTYQQGLGPYVVKGSATSGGPQAPNRLFSHSFVSAATDTTSNLFSSTADRLHAESGYMSSPERGGPRAYPAAYPPGGPGYEDPYYSQYTSRSGSITPVIDEEASDTELVDESYSLYGVKLPTAGRPVVTPQPRSQFPAPAVVPYDATRIRVEHMERQLANLTGLVQKALTQTPTAPREYLQVPPASSRDATYRNAASDEYDKHSSSSSASLPDDSYLRTDTKPPKLGKDKSVSFEKSVSFSDEPPDMNSPKQHSPQHTADSKPPKPAIKSSTLPRMSSQERTERERHKPAPPPKPVSLSPGQYEGRHVYRDLQLTPEMYNQLRGLQKKAKDLRQEVRNLRRMSQAQAHSVRETIRDTFIKIRAMLLMGGEESWAIAGDAEKIRLNREEDAYKQEMLRLEKDLTELESTVEELRGNVINRKTRVNMSDVENMALILSKSSKTVADLKVRFPSLQEGMKGLLASEMEKVVREEKFLKEEPERLESALRRCKKLTGTLVTLKRLASVQEQRLPPSSGGDARLSPTLGMGGDSDTPITPPAHGKPGAVPARSVMAPTIGGDASSRQRPENALDALLDELQTFARPPSRGSSTHNPPMADIGRKGSIDSHPLPSAPGGTTSLRRLHSYPSSSDGGGNSPPTVALSRLQADAKPPVPERNSELLSHLAGRRVPPPPPPRTSSRSPLASPTSPSLPPRGTVPPSQPQMGIGSSTLLRRGAPGRSSLREPLRGNISVAKQPEGEQSQQQQQGFNPASNSSSCESINSQEGMQNKSTTTSTTGTTTTTSTGNKARQEILEQRHQELLRKQRALQEQYARLQQLQRSGGGGLAVVPPPDLLLKKTGSESNLLAKMGLGHGLSAAAPMSGSLTHLAAVAASGQQQAPLSIAKPLTISVTQPSVTVTATAATSTTSTTTTTATTTSATTTTTNKIYETDIL